MGNFIGNVVPKGPSTTDIQNIESAFKKLKTRTFYNELGSLKSSIEGILILPSPEDIVAYQLARNRPYNVKFRGFPLVITRPKTANDVSKIVNFVRDKGEGIPLGIQCGGHSTRCMITDSFSIDLALMNDIQIDLENMLVHVGGGAYLKDIDDEMKPHNVATPVGTYPLTGVGGLVLAGGFGFLSKTHGLSVDNLVEVEIVLADGRIVVANDTNEYRDLIWGCRGGGGNFGIVTKFTMKIHKLPPSVFAGMKVYLAPTIASAKTVYQNMDKIMSTLPDEVTAVTVFPGASRVVLTAWSYFGDKPTVKDVPELNINPEGYWACLFNSIKPSDYHSEVQTITQPLNLPGNYSYTSLVQVGKQSELLPEQFYDEMLAHTRKSLHKSLLKSNCIMFGLGGKVRLADDGTKTAINQAIRHARYFVIMECVWNEKYGEEGRCAAREWVTKCVVIANHYRVTPMLHAPDAINDKSIKDAVNAKMVASIKLKDEAAYDIGYSETVLEKLRRVKGIYDQNNFFKQNANILPLKKEFPLKPEIYYQDFNI